MPITFHTADIKFSLRNRTALRAFIEKQITVALHSAPSSPRPLVTLSFIFCSDEYLLAINKQFLNHDYYTDILTFPLVQTKEELEAEIYISVDRVKENSLKFKVQSSKTKGEPIPSPPVTRPFELELRRVIFHGVLHLLGYKDKTKANKLIMRKMEDKWINQFSTYSLKHIAVKEKKQRK
ncbi:MAG: rRNA maturation RNAse YbeY [Bacteroidetes bacterium]|nr:rRNA maturation RNAse YbeY [Bacteroidota bacterium]